MANEAKREIRVTDIPPKLLTFIKKQALQGKRSLPKQALLMLEEYHRIELQAQLNSPAEV